MKEPEILARLTPAPARRAIAAGAPAGLAGVILYLAATQPSQSAILSLALLALAAGCIWVAVAIWKATAQGIELTTEDLREEGGRQLCHLDEIASVDRGLFSFRPSGGFAVILKARKPRVYAPGLWWRAGKRVMVGGATNGGAGKAMADILRVELARRDGTL
ncbi:MAG: hypothetical protein AAF914_14915 [Pseudomonadota bacterium]